MSEISRAGEVLVIGDGVIGLSTAYELARAGARCCLVGGRHDGAASVASAGLLAASVGRLRTTVAAFFSASLDRYPAFVEGLQLFDPDLRIIRGLIELPGPDPRGRFRAFPASAVRKSSEDLHDLEPNLIAPAGGILFRDDGAVDNLRLVSALRLAVDSDPRIRRITNDPVVRIDTDVRPLKVVLESGAELHAEIVILAAGAWSGQVKGLPRPLPVSPLKGQMLALASRALTHPVMGDEAYLVPRTDEIVVGATVENAGFDLTTSAEAIETLRQAAIGLCPTLAHAPVVRQWAGIRPATPDMLPIIGRDPDVPGLIYACGHSKNGILLAPATAEAITALALGQPTALDIEPFSVARFGDDRLPEIA